MARPRKPTAVLEASGAFEKNPNRTRIDEPQPSGDLGAAPAHLEREEARTWHEMADVLPPGVASNADRQSFEIMITLMVGFRHRRLSGAELSQLTALLGRFGMTPADRSKVKASENGKKDPAEKYFGDDDRSGSRILQ